MDRFTPPDPLPFEGNIAEQWRKWKQELTLYITAAEKDKKSDMVKSSILLTCIGKKGREIYNTFTFDNVDDNMKFNIIIEKFDEYCSPRKNITFQRYKFFTCRQKEGQSFDQFVTELKKLSQDCEFGELCNSLIRDVIIMGLLDNKLRERLLREPDLTLEKAIKHGQAAEETKQHARMLQRQLESEKKSIDAVKHNTKSKSNQSTLSKPNFFKNCKFCAGSHNRGSCPAYSRKCKLCNETGHFAKCCPKNSVNVVEQNEDYSSDSDFEVSTITATKAENHPHHQSSKDEANVMSVNDQSSPNDWNIILTTNGTNVTYKIDTGAQVNVLPKKLFYSLSNRPNLKPTGIKLTAYSGSNIPVIGKCIAHMKLKNRLVPVLFIVADTCSSPILGLKTSENLNLIKRVLHVNSSVTNFTEEYSDCFGEIGCLPGTHHITIHETATPVVHPPRRVPHSLKPKLKEELQRRVDLQVIEPVSGPSDWVNSMVIVEKSNGKLRICLDPRDLNQVIKRHHLQLPTAEEITARMAGARFFTKLDASSGYWQIKVDQESSKLLTFNTPFGRYRFLRLPYGVHSASEVFQASVAEILEGIEGCCNSQDDIIIWGKDQQEHDARVCQVMNKIRSSGLKLNLSKCVFGAGEIMFLGQLVSEEGIKPDPQKVAAVKEMPFPSCKKDLQRFMGMIAYLGKFIVNLSETTAPLRKLLESDSEWSFDKPQQHAFNTLKDLVTKTPILKYFDPKLPTRTSSDASKSGLGATLEQCHDGTWHPVAYASRSLTSAEQNYCQLEKETLSILFACERFHEYLYGRKFLVINDHQPLRSIFQKPLNKSPPRIQRFRLRLQKYDFDFQYVPGKQLHVADTLSRAYLREATPEISEQDMAYHIHSVISSLPISADKLKQLQKETEKDQTLQVVKDHIMNGWPKSSSDLDPSVAPYYKIQNDLSYVHNLILKDQRIVVPTALRQEMKAILHTGHSGIECCKRRARDTQYWPGINAHLEDYVASSTTCLEFRNQQQKEKLIPHDIPSEVWSKVGTDLFHLRNKDYLIIADYNTKFFEISELPNTLATTVVSHTKNVFARFGIPKSVISDNGPQFTSQEYKLFAQQWDFIHNTSSPEYPQSNGFIERTIQTVKHSLKKAMVNNEDPALALLALRTTPAKDHISPAQKLMGRTLRTNLPSIKPLLKTSKATTLSKTATAHYNTNAQNLPILHPGDHVRLRDGKNWSRMGKVVETDKNPRSYHVRTDADNVLRRNRRHLIKVKQSPPSKPSSPTFAAGEPSPINLSSMRTTRYGRNIKPPQYLY